ncbi:hypothetical protein [Streptomyces adustus]|uniref:hypothetical protein n=1 Tax=Streptomyces adustus TaxID=1609272 RepID=UPI0037203A60
MFRGTTARTVLSLLVAALLALPLCTPAAPFAPAHPARHTEAAASGPGPAVTHRAPHDESAVALDCTQPGSPANPFRTRDRHRLATRADPAPQEPERPSPTRDPAAAPRPPRAEGAALRPRRSPAAHSQAALQVFRC